jgi:methylated-DNA-protein-cysteine methyltransferase-like protein
MQSPPNPEQFNQQVWRIVRQVPLGRVTTYGQIASMLPCPPEVAPEDFQKLAPRWVGQAMNKVSAVDNPNIPWWRVINAKGGISLPPESHAALQQVTRLKKEGVSFNEKEVTDLAEFGWHGPESEWLEANGFAAPVPLVAPPSEDNPQQMSLL